jgi:hypothetical protein
MTHGAGVAQSGVIPKNFDRDGNLTNAVIAGQPAVDHIVLVSTSAQYHGKKLREAIASLRQGNHE